MNTAVCDGKELETYDAKQEGMLSLTAFIASVAGKGESVFPPRTNPLRTDADLIVSRSNNSKPRTRTI